VYGLGGVEEGAFSYQCELFSQVYVLVPQERLESQETGGRSKSPKEDKPQGKKDSASKSENEAEQKVAISGPDPAGESRFV
jgi:hypothetical protein